MKHKPTSPCVSEKEFTLVENVSWTVSLKHAQKNITYITILKKVEVDI